MYKYILYYDGGFLRDSADIGYTFETKLEASEEAKTAVDEYMNDWEIEGCEDVDRDWFEVMVEKV